VNKRMHARTDAQTQDVAVVATVVNPCIN